MIIARLVWQGKAKLLYRDPPLCYPRYGHARTRLLCHALWGLPKEDEYSGLNRNKVVLYLHHDFTTLHNGWCAVKRNDIMFSLMIVFLAQGEIDMLKWSSI